MKNVLIYVLVVIFLIVAGVIGFGLRNNKVICPDRTEAMRGECEIISCSSDEECSYINCLSFEPKNRNQQGMCWGFKPRCDLDNPVANAYANMPENFRGFCSCSPSVCS
ncbi:hypothetical protein J4233_05480 [Candidatus Pacearchaeota archaeon]|nr:hypothetical protein [Candidatus Pacearchaeota archaeon]